MNVSVPYKDILRRIATEFITYPDCLEVNEFSISTPNVRLTIRGHVADQPKLIGGAAKNIQALQAIMSEIGNNRGQSVRVSVLDSNVGTPETPIKFKSDNNWTRDSELVSLLQYVLSQALPFPSNVRADSKPLVTVLFIETELPLTPEFEFGLTTIFRAIGKNKGRIVNLHGTEQTKETVRSKPNSK